MKDYDPLRDPKPDQWLEMDEQERIALIAKYHRKAGVRLPNVNLHASMHTIIENQLAEGLPVPCEIFCRLIQDGLDRHDAIHAIASVLAEHMWHLLREDPMSGDPHERYFQALRVLTAEKWLKSAR